LTVRGCGSPWSHRQRINNDLIREAGGSFAVVEALDFQQHHAHKVAAVWRQSRRPGLPDVYCVLK
jgi:hypothetical protein